VLLQQALGPAGGMSLQLLQYGPQLRRAERGTSDHQLHLSGGDTRQLEPAGTPRSSFAFGGSVRHVLGVFGR